MTKDDFAEVEFHALPPGEGIGAWCNGKYLGLVISEGKGVLVHLHYKTVRAAGRRSRSASTSCLQSGVEHSEGSTGGLGDGGLPDI